MMASLQDRNKVLSLFTRRRFHDIHQHRATDYDLTMTQVGAEEDGKTSSIEWLDR